MLAETILGESIGVEKIGLYKHWVTEFITIQALGNSLFQIQPVGQGKKNTDVSSDLTFQYEIDESEIKVRMNMEGQGTRVGGNSCLLMRHSFCI